jgi:hypothetical protein
VEIGANIETARGVANALEIASASPRIKDFGGGGGYDMSRDLGVEMFVGFDQFVYGKGELELTARALGVAVHRAGAFVPNTTGSVSDADRALRGRSVPKMRLSRGVDCIRNGRAAKSRLQSYRSGSDRRQAGA